MNTLPFRILLIITMIITACKSTNDTNLPVDITEYQSIGLAFTIQYPSSWKIFESSDTLLISNNIETLIQTEEEQLAQPGDFLVSLSVVPSIPLEQFVLLVQNNIALLPRDASQINVEDSMLFQDLIDQNLLTIEGFETIYNTYPTLLPHTLSLQSSYIGGKDFIIIEHPISQEYSARNIKKYIIMYVLQESIVAVADIAYNTTLINNHIISTVVSIMNSITIND